MIVIVGDLHIRKQIFSQKGESNKFQKIYNDASEEFLNWVYDKFGSDIHIVFSGDFFDNANLHNEDSFSRFVNVVSRFKHKYFISGNHEYLPDYVGNPLILLKHMPGFNVYLEPTKVKIDGYDFLFLPYLPDLKFMKESYESRTDVVDYVLGHFAYPGTNFGHPDEIDISKIKAKKYFYGHIHQPQDFGNHIIIGVPKTTRYDERVWKKRIFTLEENDKLTQIDLPDFVFYEDVEFGKDPINKKSIINVLNAPSVRAVLSRYKDLNIRLSGLTLEGSSIQSINYNEQKKLISFGLEDLFKTFLSETDVSGGSDVRQTTLDTINHYFSIIKE